MDQTLDHSSVVWSNSRQPNAVASIAYTILLLSRFYVECTLQKQTRVKCYFGRSSFCDAELRRPLGEHELLTDRIKKLLPKLGILRKQLQTGNGEGTDQGII